MKFESAFNLVLHSGNELRSGSETAVLLTTKRTLLLLVILAERSGQPLSRRRIAELVWSSSDDRAARDSLRTALSALRRVLPESAILADSEQVCLAQGIVGFATLPIDGEFMPDFDDDWVVERRLQDRAQAVQQFLAEALVFAQTGDLERALEMAERACTRDPFSDEAAGLRVELLEKQGKKGMASDFSLGHRKRMLRELGAVSEVRPSEPESDSPLTAMAEWLMVRDPAEAIAFLASTRSHWEIAPAAQALDVHRRALSAAGPEARHRGYVEAQALYLQWCMGRIGPNLSSLEAAVRAACKSGDPSTAVRMATVLSYSQLSAGQFSKALETAKQVHQLAKSEGSPESLLTAEMTLGIINEHAGDPALARSLKRRIAEGAEDAEALVDAAQRYLVRANLAFTEGDLASSDDALQRARSAFLASGGDRMMGFIMILESQLLDVSGDALGARNLLLQVLQSGPDVVGHSAAAMASDLLAGVDCRLGEFASAAERLAESDNYRRSLGTVPSLFEQQRLAPVRRALDERLGPQHLARVRRASMTHPLASIPFT